MSSELRATDLLRIEELCDRFEEAVRAGMRAPTASYLAEVRPSMQKRLGEELEKTLASYSAADGLPTSNGHSVPLQGASLPGLVVGRRLGPDAEPARYELIEPVGNGASGAVWKSLDLTTGETVALKLSLAIGTETLGQMFREADSAARLAHPNIVRVRAAGKGGEFFFIARDFIDGESLSEATRRGRPDPRRVAEIGIALAKALEHAHSLGCIHRDVAPKNILLDSAGNVFLNDFGLAKSADSLTQTCSNMVMGTPAYMSPEQARGNSRDADARSDVYSLGVVIFELLTGTLPFRGNLHQVMQQIQTQEAPRADAVQPGLPPALATICQRCLLKEPRHRYPDATALRKDLERYLAGEPIQARPVSSLQRMVQFARRNPLVASLVVSVFALLMMVAGGSLLSAWSLRTAWNEERQLRVSAEQDRLNAVESARMADLQAEEAEKLSSFSGSLIAFPERFPIGSSVGIAGRGPDSDARRLLDAGRKRILAELSGHPHAQARLLDVVGNSYRSFGLLTEARECFDLAAEFRTGAALSETTKFPDQLLPLDVAQHSFFLGWLEQSLGNRDTAGQCYSEALEHCPEDDRKSLLLRSDILFQFGWLHMERRNHEMVNACFRESLSIRTKVLGAEHFLSQLASFAIAINTPGAEKTVLLVGMQLLQSIPDEELRKLADVGLKVWFLRLTNNYDKGIPQFRELIRQLEEVLSPTHHVTLLARGEFAGMLFDSGDYREAFDEVTTIIPLAERIAPEHPMLIQAKRELAMELALARRYGEAESLYTDLYGQVTGPSKFTNLLWVLVEQDKFEEASRLILTNQPPWPGLTYEEDIFRSWLCMRIFEKLGQLDESARQLHRIEEASKVLDVNAPSPVWLARVSQVFDSIGRADLARTCVETAIQKEPNNRRGPNRPRIAMFQIQLAKLLEKNGELDKAQSLVAEALDVFRNSLPADDLRIADAEAMQKNWNESR